MAAEIRHFRPGEIVFFAGTSGDEAYLIRSGQVQVYDRPDGQDSTHAHLKPGDIVGQMALVDAADGAPPGGQPSLSMSW